MIHLDATRRMIISLHATRRMVVRLTVRTAARVVAALGGWLHFDSPENSGLLGAL